MGQFGKLSFGAAWLERRHVAGLCASNGLSRQHAGARALGSERAQEGESPSLTVLPARQPKATAPRRRGVESNWKRTDSPQNGSPTRAATQTRYGLMRLTRLRAMSEVRSTADGRRGESGAKSARKPKPSRSGGAWSGWRRNVWKCGFVNQGELSRCWKERFRSQSPHSSDEAANPRGAKGDKKVET
jgi:hypothetical protein